MKRKVWAIVLLLSLVTSSGCYDQLNLEDISLVLMLGMDLDEDENFVVYTQSPVFYKEAKEKSETGGVKTVTVGWARPKLDAILTGITLAGKNQTVLIGKRLVEKRKDWADLLDLFYRDPKQSATPHVILVDGPVNEVFRFQPKDKPRLAIHMHKLIETANQRSVTVSTNLQEFRRQIKDRALTAAISEVKKDKEEIKVTGVALLSENGGYADHLSLEESSLLLMLQRRAKGEVYYVTQTPDDVIAMMIRSAKVKVKSNYVQGRFRFEISMKCKAVLTSSNKSATFHNLTSKLEKQISDDMQTKMTALVKKCQRDAVDPFGFGLYARAYQYDAWKPVQDKWGEAFSKADVRIKPDVKLESIGTLE
ncbi:Ger(x)C family spore germination protein [Tumebacillus flagellatus]|uniref:Uncharacterized protein n=1 Tax=Tumebacillus flagellatus TaxID=1157490 RepID=A0A074LTF6_9BACL|nr:Ger(x)C family spore germination protein [Tumebacillus flagellatus]KEO83835.1 hypothetical protein EL26_07920 [Tumebacillus flagellatus]